MPEAIGRLRALWRRDPAIAAAILILVLTAFVLIELWGPAPVAGPALEGKLSDAQKTSSSLIIELAKLFMGWSVAVIGGAAYFLKTNIEKDYPLTRTDLLLAELIILVSVVSIFFGHLSINFIVKMLILDVLPLDDPTLLWYIRCQYLCFLLSLLTFGAYIHSTFMNRTRSTGAKSTSGSEA